MEVNVSRLRPLRHEELTSREGVKYFKVVFLLTLSFEADLVLRFMFEANGQQLEEKTIIYEATE
jgi:hypothetical protein